MIEDPESASDEFKELLEAAMTEDLSDLERSDCIQIVISQHSEDIPVILFAPKLGFQRDNSDQATRRLMLLFIKKAHAIVSKPYVLIYAHTPMSILSQQSVIYKHYKILPRKFKKNLKQVYVIHPQFSIKMFFEFARMFLSKKFYDKLNLIHSLADFESIAYPSLLKFPFGLHLLDDAWIGLKTDSNLVFPTLEAQFVPSLGTTLLLHECIDYLRQESAIDRKGIFRIAGDESQLNLAKSRMQVSAAGPIEVRHSALGTSEHVIGFPKIVIGQSEQKARFDNTLVYKQAASKTRSTSVRVVGEKSSKVDPEHRPFSTGNIDGNDNDTSIESKKSTAQLSTVLFKDVDTIAQIIKCSLRYLKDPLIPFATFQKLSGITMEYQQNIISRESWLQSVISEIGNMPLANKSILDHLLMFLCEIAKNSSVNQMDSSNLATVFGPSVMRSSNQEGLDTGSMLQELSLSHKVMAGLIEYYLSSSESRSTSRAKNAQDDYEKIIEETNDDDNSHTAISSDEPIVSEASTSLSSLTTDLNDECERNESSTTMSTNDAQEDQVVRTDDINTNFPLEATISDMKLENENDSSHSVAQNNGDNNDSRPVSTNDLQDMEKALLSTMEGNLSGKMLKRLNKGR